jgi:hypothetical protein
MSVPLDLQGHAPVSSASRRRPRRVIRFVVYLRVSTLRQGASGLGIEAQREAVARHVASTDGRILAEVVETESGKQSTRPQLARALAICRGHRAVLLIAKLDRLARNVHFISGLMETGVPFVAADMPTATPFMLHIYAAMAEAEGIAISAHESRSGRCQGPRREAGQPPAAGRQPGPGAHGSRGEVREGDGASDGPPAGDRRGPGRRRRHAERDRQGVDGARRADPERPRCLESGDGDAAGSPSASLSARADTITHKYDL